MFDERDEQDFLDFDGDGESDLGERWSALQVFQECEEESAWRETCEDGSQYDLDPEDYETEEEYEEALEEEKYGWRETCEDGSEFGLDPEDYETEEEYEEALEEEKYGWRETCEDGSEFGLDPEDYETEEEYEEALEEEKYGWRLTCEDGSGYGLDPEDYETEEEYEEALNSEKYAWRLTCEDGYEYGLDPEDYETEDEYNDALYEEKCAWREERTDGAKYGINPDDYESEDEFEEALDRARKREKAEAQSAIVASCAVEAAGGAPDLYGRLRQEAVERLEAIREGFCIFAERKKKQEEIDKCGFILHSDAPAARYLSVGDGFLYWQAIREHFTLPIDLPDAEEEPDSSFSDIFLELAEEDPALAVKVWSWCVAVFGPYRAYDTWSRDLLYNDILSSASDYPPEFMDFAVREMADDPAFCRGVLEENSRFPDPADDYIAHALQTGNAGAAEKLFASVLRHPGAKNKALEDFIQGILYGCEQEDELEAMEAFKFHILPMIEAIEQKRIARLLPRFRERVENHIREVEATAEKYRYSRRNAWRTHCEDGSKYGLDPLDYDSEEEYNAALHEEKYGWRKYCEDGSKYGLDPVNFETEEEYEAALHEEKYGWRKYCADGSKYGLDPVNFETEEEYSAALHEEKYGWRKYCADGSKYGLDPVNFETEEEYETALHEEKYGWRKRCEDGSKYGLDPTYYESEEQYNAALHEEKYGWRRYYVSIGQYYGLDPGNYETREAFDAAREAAKEREKKAREEKKREEAARRAAPDPLADTDMTVYTFCAVRFANNDHLYYYLADDAALDVGDMVVVPVGNEGRECVAEIATVERHRRRTAPYPVDRAKRILRRHAPNEDGEQRD